MSGGPTGPTRPTRRAADPLQVVAVLAAVYLLVVGIVIVARAGFFTEGATSPVVEVGVVAGTPVLGLGLALVGLVLLWAAGGIEIDDVSIRVVAGLVLVLGIVLVIEPGAFQSTLGTGRGDGWHHILLGGLLMGVSLLPPLGAAAAAPARPAPLSPDDDSTRRLSDDGTAAGEDDPTERIR